MNFGGLRTPLKAFFRQNKNPEKESGCLRGENRLRSGLSFIKQVHYQPQYEIPDENISQKSQSFKTEAVIWIHRQPIKGHASDFSVRSSGFQVKNKGEADY